MTSHRVLLANLDLRGLSRFELKKYVFLSTIGYVIKLLAQNYVSLFLWISDLDKSEKPHFIGDVSCLRHQSTLWDRGSYSIYTYAEVI